MSQTLENEVTTIKLYDIFEGHVVLNAQKAIGQFVTYLSLLFISFSLFASPCSLLLFRRIGQIK